MKYIILPLLRIVVVIFFFIVLIGMQPTRLLIFLWEFNDDWYKNIMNTDFCTASDESYSYKTAIDFILNRKTKKGKP